MCCMHILCGTYTYSSYAPLPYSHQASYASIIEDERDRDGRLFRRWCTLVLDSKKQADQAAKARTSDAKAEKPEPGPAAQSAEQLLSKSNGTSYHAGCDMCCAVLHADTNPHPLTSQTPLLTAFSEKKSPTLRRPSRPLRRRPPIACRPRASRPS